MKCVYNRCEWRDINGFCLWPRGCPRGLVPTAKPPARPKTGRQRLQGMIKRVEADGRKTNAI